MTSSGLPYRKLSLCMVAVVTPPVGVNAYVVQGILEDVPLTTQFLKAYFIS